MFHQSMASPLRVWRIPRSDIETDAANQGGFVILSCVPSCSLRQHQVKNRRFGLLAAVVHEARRPLFLQAKGMNWESQRITRPHRVH